MALVMTWRGPAAARTTPRIARLSDSVPPEVKASSLASHADQRSHLPARGFQSLLGQLAEVVDAGSVTIHLTETQRHRFQRLRERWAL